MTKYWYWSISPKLDQMICEINLKFRFIPNISSLGGKRVELFDGAGIGDPVPEDNVRIASAASNQVLLDARKMNETDHQIERSEMVVEHTIKVGGQTAAAIECQAGCTVVMLLLILIFGLFTTDFIMEMVDPFGWDLPSSNPPPGKFSPANALGRFL